MEDFKKEMEDFKKDKDNRIVNFWMHITHGQFEINKVKFRRKWIVNTHVFDDPISLDYNFLQEYPFPTSTIPYTEFKKFNEVIKTTYRKEVAEMKYSELMDALVWYKKQAISGSKLKDRVFIKFYGKDDGRFRAYGRLLLDYDKQLEDGNIIREEQSYGVGIAAGNIENWESYNADNYGKKFLLLKALDTEEYMFCGRPDDKEKNKIDMTGGDQISGMAFKAIYKGTIDEDKRFTLQKIEESGTSRY